MLKSPINNDPGPKSEKDHPFEIEYALIKDIH